VTGNVADDIIRKSVMDLLSAAVETGVGVAFEPDEEGWKISYVLPIDWPAYTEYDLSAGPLASAYDLATAAAAAVRPLNEMGARIDRYLAERPSS
jgi:hypothetical protein